MTMLDISTDVAMQVPSLAAEVADVYIMNYNSVAALAVLAWDICITFEDEANLFWWRSWRWDTAVFILVRYFPLLVQISMLAVRTQLQVFTNTACVAFDIYLGTTSVILVCAVDWILVMRIYALYNRSKNVGIALVCLYTAEVVTAVVTFVISIAHDTYSRSCLPPRDKPVLYLSTIVTCLFHAILFSFTAVRFLTTFRVNWRESNLGFVVVRDGTWAFFLVLLIMILQIVATTTPNIPNLSDIVISWFLTVFSLCGYRVLMNLRSFAFSISQFDLTTRSSSRHVTTPPGGDLTTHFDLVVGGMSYDDDGDQAAYRNVEGIQMESRSHRM